MLQAHSGPLADIGASVQEHSRRLTWQLLGIDEASPLKQGALDGRAALEDVLMSTFFATLEAVVRHDPPAREILTRMTGPA